MSGQDEPRENAAYVRGGSPRRNRSLRKRLSSLATSLSPYREGQDGTLRLAPRRIRIVVLGVFSIWWEGVITYAATGSYSRRAGFSIAALTTLLTFVFGP